MTQLRWPKKSIVGLGLYSVQFSRSVLSDSLRHHGLQHSRLPCPSPTPGPSSNSCLLSRWCHSIMSSSVVPFSFCLQSFPTSESFPLSQFFELGGQSVGASASASVFPMNIQGWFPLGWTGLISLPLFTHLQCGNSFSQSINQSVLNKISLKTSFVLYAEKNSSVHGA